MAGNRFKNLDAEQRALHDSWDAVARVVLLVVITAVVIWGICAGLRWLVHEASDHLLEYAAEGDPIRGPLVLVVALVLGGVARGLLNRRPSWTDASYDGIDVALGNYHCTYQHAGDDPQPRYDRPAFSLSLRKCFATLLTLGTGGAGGLEGPVVLIGESTGAGVARVMAARSEHELRTYQIAGIAAAVATLLNAPFASALFAIELAYGDRIIYRKFAYALLAGTVAYILNSHFVTAAPIFIAPPHSRAYSLSDYGTMALVAVAVSAPLALAFGMTMKHTKALVSRFHPLVRGAAGGLATALVALVLWWSVDMDVRHVLGMGEWTLKLLLSTGPDAQLAWWFLMLAVLGKMLACGFTLASGGSAGLLIPSMFLGGLAGATTERLLALTGFFPHLDTAPFVVVGIASALVAVIGVPLAAIALVLEVFGSAYGPPAILACGVTYVLTLRLSVYGNQEMSPDPLADETGRAAHAEERDGPPPPPPEQPTHVH